MQHRDGEQAVRQHRYGDVRLEGQQIGIRQRMFGWEQLGQQHGDRRQRQHQGLQSADRIEETRHPVHQHGQPHDQRQRIQHAQIETATGEDILAQQITVQCQRNQHQMADRAAAQHIPFAARLRTPEIGGTEHCRRQRSATGIRRLGIFIRMF